MGMEDVVLLGGCAAIAIFGYYIMAKLDNFLDKIRQENEEQAQTTCLNIATSCVNVIPAVSNILKDINHLHPDVHCNLSVGHEQDVIKSFDCGDADVVIISADSDVESERLARWKCITLNPQSFSIDNGIVDVKTVEKNPQHQKVLWKGKMCIRDSPVFDRADGAIYKLGGVDPHKGMNWKQYAMALIGTNAVMIAIGYIILRIQSLPLLNPNGIEGMEPTLAFNTIISFMTNTNLQHYSGESGLSYLSQMLVIIFMMFVSAASGYAACVAFIRGLAGKTKDNVGNFFADLVRITTRVLLPFSLVGGLLLVWQGVPQNFSENVVVQTLEGTYQVLALSLIHI